jgi:hypothetical protein
MTDEKRRFTRIPFKVNAEITANDILYSVKEISNLSIGGCLLQIKADLEPGTICRLKIMLSGTNNELSIKIVGEINRCFPGAVAVKFTRIDPDSLFHLQNVIRYNAPDPEVIDQEIIEHPGII